MNEFSLKIRKKVPLLIFILITIGEFFLFKQHFNENILNTYPSGFDQAAYLPSLYLTYENVKKYGLMQGINLSPGLATGILYPVQAVFFLKILGVSRFSILFINFFYFIFLQIFCFMTFRNLTSNNYLQLIFLSLLLLVNTPFFNSGGNLFDVRLDFLAFCLYGIFICASINSNFFLNTKWTIFAALIASLTILLRTLTLIYFVGISFGFFIFLCGSLIGRITKAKKLTTITRLKNILLFGFMVAIITLPLVWIYRLTLYNYYVVGHILGDEKYIRLAEVGVNNIFSNLLFYPSSLLLDHLGMRALIVSGLLVISYSVFHLLSNFIPKKNQYLEVDKSIPWGLGAIFLIISILIPMLTLTSDMSKSRVVGSIMVIPTLWLIVWYVLATDKKIKFNEKVKFLLNISAIFILVFTLYQHKNEYRHGLNKYDKIDQANIVQMYLDIGNYTASKKLSILNISFDQVIDYLTSGGIATLYYENTGNYLTVAVMKLGGMIFTINKQEILESLEKTNVLVINLGEYSGYSPYPFNQSVAAYRHLIQSYAMTHFKILGNYAFKKSTYRVFVA